MRLAGPGGHHGRSPASGDASTGGEPVATVLVRSFEHPSPHPLGRRRSHRPCRPRGQFGLGTTQELRWHDSRAGLRAVRGAVARGGVDAAGRLRTGGPNQPAPSAPSCESAQNTGRWSGQAWPDQRRQRSQAMSGAGQMQGGPSAPKQRVWPRCARPSCGPAACG